MFELKIEGLRDVYNYSLYLQKEIRKALNESVSYIAEDIRREVRRRMIPDNTLPRSGNVGKLTDRTARLPITFPKRLRTGYIRRRTGALHESIYVFGAEKGDEVYYEVGINPVLPYGHIQEQGGVITAKHRKYMAIPTDAESWRKSPRDFTDTFVSKNIVFKKIKKGLYKPLFLLKRKVTLKPARFFEFGFKQTNIDRRIQQLVEKLSKIIGKAGS